MVRLWNVSNVSLLLHNTHITELFDVAAQSLLKLFLFNSHNVLHCLLPKKCITLDLALTV